MNVAAGVAYGLVVRAAKGHTAGETIRVLFRAEAVKIVVTVVGLWLALTRFAPLEPLSFMTAFLLTVLIGPFASLRPERGT